MSKPKIALIPAYEPADTLISLVESLAHAEFFVLVVDDGSGPAYARIFSALEPGAIVLSYQRNQGKGHALKVGFDYLSKHFPPESIVVTLDGDGQHTVFDAERVAAAAATQPGALTLGVRSFGPGTPARSKFGNTVTRLVYRLSTGQRVSDTQTGLRACGGVLLPAFLNVPGERYEYEMNVLMACPRQGIPFQEVNIETIYLNGNRGSHFKAFRDSFRVYGKLLKFAASSLTCFAVDYTLYSLLVTLLAGLGSAVYVPLSNIAARVVSAGVNFTLNRRFVFQSEESALKAGAQYFALAGCILACNTVLLSVLVNTLGINPLAAKLVTEVTFFSLSFLFQRFVIFRGHPRETAASTEQPDPFLKTRSLL